MQTRQPESETPGALGRSLTSRVDPAECEQSIAERFEQQVALYRDRLAVKTRHHALSYAALNRSANRVAHTLLRHADRPGQRIGLLLDHDAPLIAAVLGTLKAGMVYVPLNPSHPLERSRAMVASAQAALILTDTRHHSAAVDLVGQAGTVVDLDDLAQPGPEANVNIRVLPDDLAYILFTSGSTGEPKGVVQLHRNVLHFALEHAASCQIGPDDRLTLLASLSYAAAGLNLYGALLNGAAVFPFNPREASVGELVDWLEREQISVYHSVPTVFRNVAGTLSGARRLHQLRAICLGGEPALKRDIDLFHQAHQHFGDGCVLVNGLASTETMVIRRYFVDAHTRFTSRVLAAGYPVDGVEVFLVDEAGKRLGSNQVGEIVVRSRYLVPGYWQQPALTAQAFTTDASGLPLYRTGDLGRLLPDGCLEYIGRKDLQVKVRGHRVEPAEVELALLELEGVEEAAVVPRRRAGGDSELVAYLVLKDRPLPTLGELRRSLSRTLSEPLIPAALVAVDALPRTANGKVDRAALTLPSAHRATGAVPARNLVEAQLVELWENVLGVSPVGVTDDFFELGGHSLLASLLVTEIERVFGKRLAPASLFPDATLRTRRGCWPTIGSRPRQRRPRRWSRFDRAGRRRHSSASIRSVETCCALRAWPITSVRTSRSMPSRIVASQARSRWAISRRWPPTTSGCCATCSQKVRIASAASRLVAQWPLRSPSNSTPLASRSPCWPSWTTRRSPRPTGCRASSRGRWRGCWSRCASGRGCSWRSSRSSGLAISARAWDSTCTRWRMG